MKLVQAFPWNGSKGWLVGPLEQAFNAFSPTRYIDPFMGSGIPSKIARALWPNVPQVLGDINPWLVAFWKVCARKESLLLSPDFSIKNYRLLEDQALITLSDSSAAERFLVCLYSAWGNRWLTASSGKFTATLNKNWTSYEFLAEKFRGAIERGNHLHKGDQISSLDWIKLVQEAKPGDLVYLDPPYPDSTGYGDESWTLDNTLDVLDWAVQARDHGIHVVVSNMASLTRLFERSGFSCSLHNRGPQKGTSRTRVEMLATSLVDLHPTETFWSVL